MVLDAQAEATESCMLLLESVKNLTEESHTCLAEQIGVHTT